MTHAADNDKVAAMIGFRFPTLRRYRYHNPYSNIYKRLDFKHDANAQDFALEWVANKTEYDYALGYDRGIYYLEFWQSPGVRVLYVENAESLKLACFEGLVQLANHLTAQK